MVERAARAAHLAVGWLRWHGPVDVQRVGLVGTAAARSDRRL